MSWMIARRLAHARKRHYTFAGRTVSSLNANQSRPGRSSSENNDLPAVCESFARSHAALVRGEAFCSLRLSVRTPPFHGGESGSIPLGSANDFKGLAASLDSVSSRYPEFGPSSGLPAPW